uniref:Uncharacterized protein n=1 Tax=Anguilla anguilla TaxID=7936 RepID=A0A0E9TFY7_ANGAN
MIYIQFVISMKTKFPFGVKYVISMQESWRSDRHIHYVISLLAHL